MASPFLAFNDPLASIALSYGGSNTRFLNEKQGDLVVCTATPHQNILFGNGGGGDNVAPTLALGANKAIVSGDMAATSLTTTNVWATGFNLRIGNVTPIAGGSGGLSGRVQVVGTTASPIDGGTLTVDLMAVGEGEVIVHLSPHPTPLTIRLAYNNTSDVPESVVGTKVRLWLVERSLSGRPLSLDRRLIPQGGLDRSVARTNAAFATPETLELSLVVTSPTVVQYASSCPSSLPFTEEAPRRRVAAALTDDGDVTRAAFHAESETLFFATRKAAAEAGTSTLTVGEHGEVLDSVGRGRARWTVRMLCGGTRNRNRAMSFYPDFPVEGCNMATTPDGTCVVAYALPASSAATHGTVFRKTVDLGSPPGATSTTTIETAVRFVLAPSQHPRSVFFAIGLDGEASWGSDRVVVVVNAVAVDDMAAGEGLAVAHVRVGADGSAPCTFVGAASGAVPVPLLSDPDAAVQSHLVAIDPADGSIRWHVLTSSGSVRAGTVAVAPDGTAAGLLVNARSHEDPSTPALVAYDAAGTPCVVAGLRSHALLTFDAYGVHRWTAVSTSGSAVLSTDNGREGGGESAAGDLVAHKGGEFVALLEFEDAAGNTVGNADGTAYAVPSNVSVGKHLLAVRYAPDGTVHWCSAATSDARVSVGAPYVRSACATADGGVAFNMVLAAGAPSSTVPTLAVVGGGGGGQHSMSVPLVRRDAHVNVKLSASGAPAWYTVAAGVSSSSSSLTSSWGAPCAGTDGSVWVGQRVDNGGAADGTLLVADSHGGVKTLTHPAGGGEGEVSLLQRLTGDGHLLSTDPPSASSSSQTAAAALRNRVTNGDMSLDTLAVCPVSVGHGFEDDEALVIDGWRVVHDADTPGCGSFTVDRVPVVCGGVNPLPHALALTTGRGVAEVAPPAYQGLRHRIPASSLRDFGWDCNQSASGGRAGEGGSHATLSFWVKASSAPTVLGVTLASDQEGAAASFGALYAIAQADTWERKTVRVPPPPHEVVVGGLWLTFCFATATATAATPRGWSDAAAGSSFPWSVVGQDDMTRVAGNTWSVTGVQLEVGDAVTPFEDGRPATLEGLLAGEALHARGDVYSNGGEMFDPVPLVPRTAMQKVQALAGCTFKRDGEAEGATRHMGLDPAAVRAVAPEAVSRNAEGELSVAYGALMPLVLEALKFLSGANAVSAGFGVSALPRADQLSHGAQHVVDLAAYVNDPSGTAVWSLAANPKGNAALPAGSTKLTVTSSSSYAYDGVPYAVGVEATNAFGLRVGTTLLVTEILYAMQGVQTAFGTGDGRFHVPPTMRSLQEAYAGKPFEPFLSLQGDLDGYQRVPVPRTDRYTFTAVGARGGASSTTASGGNAAMVRASFDLKHGQSLIVVCGQRGADGEGGGGGGGGASWVVLFDPAAPLTQQQLTPLLVGAGSGGGGGGTGTGNAGYDGSGLISASGSGESGGASGGVGYDSFGAAIFGDGAFGGGGKGGEDAVGGGGGGGGGYKGGNAGGPAVGGQGGWSFCNSAYAGFVAGSLVTDDSGGLGEGYVHVSIR